MNICFLFSAVQLHTLSLKAAETGGRRHEEINRESEEKESQREEERGGGGEYKRENKRRTDKTYRERENYKERE